MVWGAEPVVSRPRQHDSHAFPSRPSAARRQTENGRHHLRPYLDSPAQPAMETRNSRSESKVRRVG